MMSILMAVVLTEKGFKEMELLLSFNLLPE